MESGIRVSFIQNESGCSWSKMKSMPASSASVGRPESPVCRSASVSAISTWTGIRSPREFTIVETGNCEAWGSVAAGVSSPEGTSLWATAEVAATSNAPNASTANTRRLFIALPSQNSLFVNGPPRGANTRLAEGTSSRDRLSAKHATDVEVGHDGKGLMVELSQVRSCTSVAPAMLAQWAQQYREPFASTPCPMILTPQYSQVGASAWIAHSKLSNVR